MRSGYFHLLVTTGTFGGAGVESLWWSSRAYSDANHIYDLWFNGTDVIPSRGPSARYHGFPLRCLSTVLGM